LLDRTQEKDKRNQISKMIRLDAFPDHEQHRITQIIHVADIHLRTGDLERSRYEEYRAVLGRLCDEVEGLQSVKRGEAVMILAGDLFHSKGRLDTPGATMFFEWMDRLLQVVPVIAISGNHDLRQDDATHPDMVDTMTQPYRTGKWAHPLFYLSETGHYIYRNLGIGFVSIRDTLKPGNTRGIADELPPFPSASAFDGVAGVEHTCALFQWHRDQGVGVCPLERLSN